jgi:poly-gamma-glutamate synthesis protein (capsule biosynthesis protein)
MATVIVGGDICPAGAAQHALAGRNCVDVFHDLMDEFHAADLTVVNLECPLISKPTPVLKFAATLGARRESIRGLASAGIDVLNLANSHICDHGVAGIEDTLDAIGEAGLAGVGVGAGRNIAEASAPLVRFCDQQREKYLGALFGYHRTMRKVRDLLLWLLHSKHDLLHSLNMVQCETHREVLTTIYSEEQG